MEKEVLNKLIEIYKSDDGWHVDYIGGTYHREGINVGHSENSEIEAIKFALINLAIERMKLEEFHSEITDIVDNHNTFEHDMRYKDLAVPTIDDKMLADIYND